MPRIYKAANVQIDADNKVQINVRSSDIKAAEEIAGEPPEAKALGIIEKARKEAAAIKTMAVAEAEAIKKAARDKAAALTAKTKGELQIEGETLRKNKETEGYKEGYTKGESAGEELRLEAQKMLEDAIAERDKMREELEPDTVALVIDIIKKLLDTSVEINPALITALIRKGFAEATLTGDITVKVAKEDYDTVLADKEKILSAAGSSVSVEILPDSSLAATDCVIETSYGVIDCSLTHQYNSLCDNLKYLAAAP